MLITINFNFLTNFNKKSSISSQFSSEFIRSINPSFTFIYFSNINNLTKLTNHTRYLHSIPNSKETRNHAAKDLTISDFFPGLIDYRLASECVTQRCINAIPAFIARDFASSLASKWNVPLINDTVTWRPTAGSGRGFTLQRYPFLCGVAAA